MFHRYYPHRHYYHVHGYRGAYYGNSFGGFFFSLGFILLIIGLILSFDDWGFFMGFFPLFWAGAAIMAVSAILMMVFSARMAGLRRGVPDDEPPMDSSAPVGNTISSTTTTTTTTQTAPRTGRCSGCGASGSGTFCDFCGSRMG
jgi:hypothetical protein